MSPERIQPSENGGRAEGQDLKWINENREILWLTATVAFVEIGYGLLVVDLTQKMEDQGHPFGYYAEGELEGEDEVLRAMIQSYDPDRECIVQPLNGKERAKYLGTRPAMGWQAEMRTPMIYQKSEDLS